MRSSAPDGSGRTRRHLTLALGDTLVFAVDGGPGAGADARLELTKQLAGKLDRETVELVCLLTSELVNNCVVHGAAAQPGTWIDTSVFLFLRTLRVEVSDGGPSFRHRPQPPNGQPGSNGLYLVEQLSRQWGISEHRTSRVWFELDRPRAADTE